jgi:Tfp pilus assembly protein PilX
MFRSNGVQELIAGNIREKQRAAQTAEGAELYAEMWLATGGNSATISDCSSFTTVVPWPNPPYACNKSLAATIGSTTPVYNVPWKIGGAGSEIGFEYFPGAPAGTGDLTVQATPAANSYKQVPRFFIGEVANLGYQVLYRIDAWNYASTTDTVSVVESNYLVTCTAC